MHILQYVGALLVCPKNKGKIIHEVHAVLNFADVCRAPHFRNTAQEYQVWHCARWLSY